MKWPLNVTAGAGSISSPLSAEVAEFFGACITGHRGMENVLIKMMKMAMGWSWAPSIGQRTSNVLVRGIGKAWVDNLILAAKTKEQLSQNSRILQERLTKANVEVDNLEFIAVSKIEVLGLVVDLQNKTYQLNESFLAKITTLQREQLGTTMTLRHIYQLLGSLLWAAYIRKLPLCQWSGVVELMSVVAEVASTNFGTAVWDTSYQILTLHYNDMEKLLKTVLDNPPTSLSPSREATHVLCTDASTTYGAFMVVDLQTSTAIAAEHFPFKDSEKLHIFIKEMLAAAAGLKWCASHGIHNVTMHVDNTAVMHCYNKLHSTVPFANALLAQSVNDGMDITAAFVPTQYNCVDQFTRPVENPQAPPQTPFAVHPQIIVLKDGTRAAYQTFRL